MLSTNSIHQSAGLLSGQYNQHALGNLSFVWCVCMHRICPMCRIAQFNHVLEERCFPCTSVHATTAQCMSVWDILRLSKLSGLYPPGLRGTMCLAWGWGVTGHTAVYCTGRFSRPRSRLDTGFFLTIEIGAPYFRDIWQRFSERPTNILSAWGVFALVFLKSLTKQHKEALECECVSFRRASVQRRRVGSGLAGHWGTCTQLTRLWIRLCLSRRWQMSYSSTKRLD